MQKYTRGWIRVQALGGLEKIGWTPGIATNDTELEHQEVILLMSHFSGLVGRPVEWKRATPRHKGKKGTGISISTVVGYLEEVLNANNGTLPESESP